MSGLFGDKTNRGIVKELCKMKNLLFLLNIGIVCVQAWGAVRAVTPDPWGGNADSWQMKRHLEKMVLVKKGGSPVVFIGDSITHNWESVGKEQWNKYFVNSRYTALNLGTSADRTEHVLWRLQNGELDGYEAKAIVLMIGTNNSGHFPFAKETPIDTVYGIHEILRVIKEKQPTARTILCPIFPRGPVETDALRRRNETVNRRLKGFADGKSVIWCDFNDKFLDAQGRLSQELFPDLLHPNALGYEIWASAVKPVIEQVLSANPDDYIPSVWPSVARGYIVDTPLTAQAYPGTRYWPDRYFEKQDTIADGGSDPYELVMIGDSITHRWERKGGEGHEFWQELIKSHRLLNLGYGGDRVQDVIWRLENGELEGYTAKYFSLMIGTNNGRDRAPDIASGIKRIVELITSRHPESKLILTAIFPRGKNESDKIHRLMQSVNELIKPLANGKNVLWLDMKDQFMSGNDSAAKYLSPDLLHVNPDGYRLWWRNLESILVNVP